MITSIKGYLTPKEAAEELGIATPTIYNHMDEIEHVKLDGFYLIPESELEKEPLKSITPGRGKAKKKKKLGEIQYVSRRNDQKILCDIMVLRDEGLSYRKIADRFNELGIANTRGKYWSGQSIHNYEKRYDL